MQERHLNPAVLLWRQFVIEWKLYARDRHAMFWGFMFPIALLVGLGTVFGSGESPRLTLIWVPPAVVDHRDDALLAALVEARLEVVTLTADDAGERWRRGDTAAELSRDGDGLRMRLNSYLLVQGQATAQAVDIAYLVSQARLSGAPEPARMPVTVESPGRSRTGNYAEFLLPGLLGLNLLTMGLFSVGMVNVAYREKGKFRRLAVTPLQKWIFLSGQICHRVTLTVAQATAILLVGWGGFGIANRGSYLLLIAILLVGTAAFMALGFALSSFADTTEAYSPLANLVLLPMMFLSGVYFTLDAAPRWLQSAVQVLPLSPYLKALRAVFNDGVGLAGHGGGLLVVALWGAAAFTVALKRFRWA